MKAFIKFSKPAWVALLLEYIHCISRHICTLHISIFHAGIVGKTLCNNKFWIRISFTDFITFNQFCWQRNIIFYLNSNFLILIYFQPKLKLQIFQAMNCSRSNIQRFTPSRLDNYWDKKVWNLFKPYGFWYQPTI